MNRQMFWSALYLTLLTCAVVQADDRVSELIAQIHSVRGEGAGAQEARGARDELAAMGPEVLPALLVGMDTTDTVAANWVRSAFDEIVDRTLQASPSGIPAEAIQAFFLDPKRQGRARRLALEALAQLDADFPGRVIPTMLDDPEFRFDAVALVLEVAEQSLEQKDGAKAAAAYRKAFEAARDEAQVRTAANKLRDLEQEVSVVAHLGYLVDWYLVGPFDGPGFQSFSTVYPPEKELDLKASYEGKSGPIRWKRHRTPDEFGTVNLAGALAQVDSAVAYAFTTVESDRAREVQIRCGADDNLSIWLNGEKVFAKEEWKNGTRFDRFTVPVRLREGTNRILVKVCNAPPYADPSLGNPWSVQMRICDTTGKGIVLPSLVGFPEEDAAAGE